MIKEAAGGYNNGKRAKISIIIIIFSKQHCYAGLSL